MRVAKDFAHITESPIDTNRFLPKDDKIGAFVFFAGIVRNLNEGKDVTHLEYEAFAPMADEMIGTILADARKKWDLLHTHCVHRLGVLQVSEVAVLVTTGSMHRAEAYEANRYIIDRVKHEVPIWKKEYFADGTSSWSKGCVHGESGHH
ncbi:molybdopterin converting factor [Leptospira wolffii]|uniref:Molybdopterin synthase catalytic subunit n=1 Tax=Leptospira wolffii TaxID=409998 RepID=A0A2M9Z7I5_9LEPT|nr:molybdenum cofactor biosynthesis protein MoaE [Leptospira wolffii]PJZ64393.1 molybdopterin converting factor [Leptospira wolffii]